MPLLGCCRLPQQGCRRQTRGEVQPARRSRQAKAARRHSTARLVVLAAAELSTYGSRRPRACARRHPPLGSGQSHGHLGCPHSRPGAARRRRSDFASGHPGHRASQTCLVRATAPRPYVAEAAALCTQAVTMPTQAAPAAGSRLGWRSSTNRRRWRIIVAPAQSPLQRKTRRSSSTAAWWAAWPLAERSNTSATAAEPHTRGTHPLRTCTCAPAQPAHTQSFPRSAVHSTYTPRWPSLPSSHRPSGHSLRQEGDCQGGRASPSTRGGYEQRSCRRGAYAPR